MRPLPAFSRAVIPAGAALLLLGVAQPSASQGAGSLPLASGRIIYKMAMPLPNGMVMGGINTLSWIEHGKRFRQEMEASATGPQQTTTIQNWTIGDGKYLYVYQPMFGKQILRTKMPKVGAGQSGPASFSTHGKNAGKLIGRAKLLGKPCEIRQSGSAKLWSWRGLMLKMEKSADKTSPAMRMEAVRLEERAKLNPADFRVPKGYKITDKMPAGLPGGAPIGTPK